MTAFEFVFGLFSIIIGLGLTHLLGGLVGLIRNAERVRFSWLHALWMVTGAAVLIGNWASIWPLRSIPSWPAWSMLMSIAAVVGIYLIAALVTPDIPAEGEIDLVAFHEREHRRYIGAYIALVPISWAVNATFGLAGQYDQWLRDSVVALVSLPFLLLPFLVRAAWAQWIGAVSGVVMSVGFMLLGAVAT